MSSWPSCFLAFRLASRLLEVKNSRDTPNHGQFDAWQPVALRPESCFSLVLQSEALAVDVDDDRVVQDAIEHRRGEHAVAGERAVPTAEGEIGSEDQPRSYCRAVTWKNRLACLLWYSAIMVWNRVTFLLNYGEKFRLFDSALRNLQMTWIRVTHGRGKNGKTHVGLLLPVGLLRTGRSLSSLAGSNRSMSSKAECRVICWLAAGELRLNQSAQGKAL